MNVTHSSVTLLIGVIASQCSRNGVLPKGTTNLVCEVDVWWRDVKSCLLLLSAQRERERF